jgi:signal transduction histidine kinase
MEPDIIGKMHYPDTWPPISPLEWITLTVHWLCFATVPLAAGLAGKLSLGLAVVVIVWGVSSLVIGLLWASGWRPGWVFTAVAVLDLVFAVAGIILSGGAGSPLWGSLLVAAVTGGLASGRSRSLTFAGAGAGVAAAAVLLSTRLGASLLMHLGTYLAALMMAAAWLGGLANRIRRLGQSTTPKAKRREEPLKSTESERIRAVFHLASELNATLNYEKVLEMALDLGESAIADSGPEGERLVSALLLFDGENLRIASARRLTHSDMRVVLPGEEGLIAEALKSGDPSVCQDPARDPELQRIVAFHNCAIVLVVPLVAGLKAHGALIFGHHRPGYFDRDRMEMLEAIGHQSMVALQNARLYRDLEQEKERITEIQEEARKKLARDLHDGPTQSIAAIAMRVNFARRLMERDSRAASDELFKVEDLARRTTKEIRHMLFTLRPLILESQGLVAALSQLAEKLRETHGQNVTIEAQPGAADDLEIGKQGVIFYIAEEAVNNARKHAEAQHVWVRLLSREGLFVLEVQDDGVGFNVGAVDSTYAQRGSLGMVNMRERTELVNGLFHIESAEGVGTRIVVVVPMTEESADRLKRSGYVS